MKTFIARLAAIIATGLLLSIGGLASAQPAFGHGHGAGAGPGMDIGHVLTALQAKLNLNTMQQGMWATATAQSASTRDAMRANMQKLHDTMAAELAKTAPDLNAVATAADDLQAADQTLRRSARDQWLKLYATFTPEQVAVVRDALQQHMAHMDSMRAKMAERMQKHGS